VVIKTEVADLVIDQHLSFDTTQRKMGLAQMSRLQNIPLSDAMLVNSFYTFEPAEEEPGTRLVFQGHVEFRTMARLVKVTSPVLEEMIENFLHKQQKLLHKAWTNRIAELNANNATPKALRLPNPGENLAATQVLTMLRTMFQEADSDGSGELATAEIAQVLKQYYVQHDRISRPLKQVQAEVDEALLTFDRDSSGALSFSEFVTMFCTSATFHFRIEPEVQNEVLLIAQDETELSARSVAYEQGVEINTFFREMFKESDTDGSGTLNSEELALLVKAYYKKEKVGRAIKTVKGEVDRAMQEFDTDGSGCLDYKEFINMVLHSKEFKFKLGDRERQEIQRVADQPEPPPEY